MYYNQSILMLAAIFSCLSYQCYIIPLCFKIKNYQYLDYYYLKNLKQYGQCSGFANI